MATCNNCSLYQCSILIIFFEFFNIAFLICLTVLFKVSLNDDAIKEIKNAIYPGTPIYDLTFFYNVQQANYMEILSFYIYGGRTSDIGTKNIKIFQKYIIRNLVTKKMKEVSLNILKIIVLVQEKIVKIVIKNVVY